MIYKIRIILIFKNDRQNLAVADDSGFRNDILLLKTKIEN